jgi:hypothetical protein
LKENVEYWIKHENTKTLEIIQLYYDQNLTDDDA